MTRPALAIVSAIEFAVSPVSLTEKFRDHQAIVQGYLDTHLTRNHSERTIEGERRLLTSWFEDCPVPDDESRTGDRQLFAWEAMEPGNGRQRIQAFSRGLVESGLRSATARDYLGTLRRLFDYVERWPYVPGETVTAIASKYGSVEQPVLEYDYPAHALDHEQEGFILTGQRLVDFNEFVRIDYVSSNQKKTAARRDYTMILVAGESGLRASEIGHLDALPPHRDLFYEQSRLQTRYGKATNGSGSRTRKTIFTPLLQETMRVYEARVRTEFPNFDHNPALFLTESGERVTYAGMWRSLDKIVKQARNAGLDLPPKLSWHDLRRSFATNLMEKHPEQVWVLMDMMGHTNPFTLQRYVKHERAYFDQAIDAIASDLAKSRSQPGAENVS